ncbi:MAG: DUF1592 domain-containing protein [Myxococcota bacterium]
MGRWFALVLALGACTGDIGSSGPIDRTGPPAIEPPTPENVGEFEAPAPVVRRLTRDEYTRTVVDVVGVELSDASLAQLPVDRPVEGFVRVASGQSVLPDHVRAYFDLAFEIVEAPAFGAFVDDHATCRDATAACGEAFIASAGRVLFRLPLETDEESAFGELFAAVLAEEGTFDEGARAVGAAMLQSPGFLYLLRRENTGGSGNDDDVYTIGGYAMASRLSYFLWGSAPDEALYEAAERGDLDTPEGVEREAMRLLDDRARVSRTLGRFLVDWARLESIPDDDGLKDSLIEGAVAYYVDRTEEGAELFRLFSDERVTLLDAFAPRFGERGDTTVRLEAGGGLLGQPGVIAGMTNADGGEIVARGLFLLAQLFCETPPDFPDDAQDEVDEFVEAQPEDASHRQIADARLERPQCGFCHGDFDPLAYAFESFDARGFPRVADEHGNAIQVDGWVPAGLNGGVRADYAGFTDYMAILEGSTQVQRCLTQRQAEYAAATRMQDGQLASLFAIEGELEGASDHRSLVRALVRSDFFRLQERIR